MEKCADNPTNYCDPNNGSRCEYVGPRCSLNVVYRIFDCDSERLKLIANALQLSQQTCHFLGMIVLRLMSFFVRLYEDTDEIRSTRWWWYIKQRLSTRSRHPLIDLPPRNEPIKFTRIQTRQVVQTRPGVRENSHMKLKCVCPLSNRD